MFSDIGALELVTLVVLGVLVFGPEKLPKLIQDASGMIRKLREFSESAKQDIRSELGPEFKDFDFEDLNPKTFVRKQLMDNDDLGLREIRSSFDLKSEMAEVADAVHGRDSGSSAGPANGSNGSAGKANLSKDSTTTPDLLTKRETPAQAERPPFDADAT
ncbi:Sec-independent protein translocase subunit TatB [Streptomyces sp. ISL-96]|uniref:sec-independent translocase n=1 Tax=Streptomyces sp. ISL-96 TaxID=2819191 RepID=UPI001BEBBF6B|nr:sec-independent translocase [Streptomyces sp. ISL-96]MBT2489267.1 Sec-independent protein translocase subunit TatB [Streptomyces sp. ISL-96]